MIAQKLSVIVAVILGLTTTVMSEKKVVCYYGSWAVYRQGDGKMAPANIDPNVCTHLIYTFVGLGDGGTVHILDPYCDLPNDYGLDGYGKVNALKKINPKLKTIISMGGWNEGSTKYSQALSNPSTRQTFVKNVVDFVIKYKFDGFDLDWEYPNQRGGQPSDVQTYISVLSELHQALQDKGLTLSIAVGAAKSSASLSYNIPEVNKNVDFINLMTYDLHGSWDSYIGLNAPLYRRADEPVENQNNLNVDAAVTYWLSQGADPTKLILGVPLYGRTFKLADPNKITPQSPSAGAGITGPYSNQLGFIGYNEICDIIKDAGWQKYFDEEQKTPYMVRGNDWVGYDDEQSARLKAQYALDKGLGGVMVWSIETDDFRGVSGRKFPILSTLYETVNGHPAPETTTPDSSSSTTSHSTTTVGPTTSTVAPSPTSTVSPTDDTVCTGPGIVRDKTDCSVFYICQEAFGHYIGYRNQCANGLWFDVKINACNYKQLVDCSV